MVLVSTLCCSLLNVLNLNYYIFHLKKKSYVQRNKQTIQMFEIITSFKFLLNIVVGEVITKSVYTLKIIE